MPTRLPYLKGTSQFLTTGGEVVVGWGVGGGNFLKVDGEMQLLKFLQQ